MIYELTKSKENLTAEREQLTAQLNNRTAEMEALQKQYDSVVAGKDQLQEQFDRLNPNSSTTGREDFFKAAVGRSDSVLSGSRAHGAARMSEDQRVFVICLSHFVPFYFD